jgi:hypothetical protein
MADMFVSKILGPAFLSPWPLVDLLIWQSRSVTESVPMPMLTRACVESAADKVALFHNHFSTSALDEAKIIVLQQETVQHSAVLREDQRNAFSGT